MWRREPGHRQGEAPLQTHSCPLVRHARETPSLILSDWPRAVREVSGVVISTLGSTHTARRITLGTTTEKMKQGIKKAAGTVQEAAEQGKDATVRAVDKDKVTAARGAKRVQKTTDRAAEQAKDA